MAKITTDLVSISALLINVGIEIISKIVSLFQTVRCGKEALSALKDTIMRIEPIVKRKHRDKGSAIDIWFEKLAAHLNNASWIVEQCTKTGRLSLCGHLKTLITELTKDIEKHLQLSNLLVVVQNQEILEGQRQIKEALASSGRFADTAKAAHTPIGIMNSKKNGANLGVEDAGSLLRKAIADGNAELLRRLLDDGVNSNFEDYNHRTPLHMAAAEGLHLLARILLDSGASVFSLDRWGNTPLDEAKKCGSRPVIQILEEAEINASGLVSTECLKDSENKKGAYSFKDSRREISEPTEKIRAKICTVFPFHPWTPIEKRRNGLVMWVPETIEALLQATAQHFGSVGTTVLTEDAGEILFIDLIQHNQKLYIGNVEELR